MPIQTQIINIPLAKGLDSKTDPKLTQGNLILENADQDLAGTINKRNGITEIAKTYKTEIDFDRAKHALRYGYSIFPAGDTFGVCGSTAITDDAGTPRKYSGLHGPACCIYNDGLGEFVEKTRLLPITYESNVITHNNWTVGYCDSAVTPDEDYSAFVYRDGNSERSPSYSVRVDFVDTATKTIIRSVELESEAAKWANQPIRVLFLSYDEADVEKRYFAIARHDASPAVARIKCDLYDIDNIFADPVSVYLNSVQNTQTEGSYPYLWDWCFFYVEDSGYSKLYVTYAGSDGEIYLEAWDTEQLVTLASPGPEWEVTSFDGNTAINCLGCWASYSYDVDPHIYVGFQDSATNDLLLYSVLISEEDIDVSETLKTIPQGEHIDNICGTPELYELQTTTANDTENRVFWEVRGRDGYEAYIESVTTHADGSMSPQPVKPTLYHAEMISKPFTFRNRAYVLTLIDDLNQPTYVLWSCSPTKYVHPQAVIKNAGNNHRNHLTHPTVIGTSVYLTAEYAETINTLERQTGSFSIGLKELKFTMGANVPYIRQGKDTYLGGGLLRSVYNGVPEELGYINFPHKPRVKPYDTHPTTGNLPDGVYGLNYFYQHGNRKGEIVRSAPAVPAITVCTNGSDTKYIRSELYYYTNTDHITHSDAYGEGHQLALFRTKADGTIYYLCDYLDNDINANYTYYNFDGYFPSDADLNEAGTEPLYTTSGAELPAICPSAPYDLAIVRDQFFIVPADQRDRVVYSKPKVDGIEYEFHPDLAVSIPEDGDITALGVLNDSVIIFKKNAIYGLSGQGYAADGRDANFFPFKIQSSVGAVNNKSVVSTDQGVFFKSEHGIYLLSGGQQIQYIGAPVETYNDETIIQASYLPTKHIVRFHTNNTSGLVLNYNILYDQWSVYTGTKLLATSAAKYSTEDYAWLRQSGVASLNIYKTSDNFSDDGSNITMTVQTPWIKTAGLAGFQRVLEFMVFGEHRSAHTMKVEIYKNYSDTASQTIYFSSKSTASSGDPIFYRSKIGNPQRCNSISFKISDSTISGTGESFSLTSIGLKVGTYPTFYQNKRGNG